MTMTYSEGTPGSLGPVTWPGPRPAINVRVSTGVDPATIGRAIARALRTGGSVTPDRIRWDREWEALTGRRWGWEPPMTPRVAVHLGVASHGADTEVWVEDIPLHRLVCGIRIERSVSDAGAGDLVLTIPMARVALF